SHDGKQLALASAEGELLLVHADTGKELWTTGWLANADEKGLRGGSVPSLTFSRDGRALVAATLREERIAEPDRTGIQIRSAAMNVLLWDWPAVCARATAAPPAEPLEELWQALGSADAEEAHLAQLALTATPGPTVTLLKARLKPVVPPDAKRVGRLLTDL